MSIFKNGKNYGSTQVINYSATPDYNRGVIVDNIQSGNYVATDNGFLLIQIKSEQSNPTKVSVVRSKKPITNTGTEIASIVLSQYQYLEMLTAQVMAHEYYKLVIEGAGNPQVISCMFYPYASTVPMKLTENIGMEQVDGLNSELDEKVDNTDLTNYYTKTETNAELAEKSNTNHTHSNYATIDNLTDGLSTKQNIGNYFNKDTDKLTRNLISSTINTDFVNMLGTSNNTTVFPFYTGTTMTTAKWMQALQNSINPNSSATTGLVYFYGLVDLPEIIIATIYSSRNPHSKSCTAFGIGLTTNTLYGFNLNNATLGWVVYNAYPKALSNILPTSIIASGNVTTQQFLQTMLTKFYNNFPEYLKYKHFHFHWIYNAKATMNVIDFPFAAGAMEVIINDSNGVWVKAYAYRSTAFAIGCISNLNGSTITFSGWKIIRNQIYSITDSIGETKANTLIRIWVGTQAEYNALASKDVNTLYFCK